MTINLLSLYEQSAREFDYDPDRTETCRLLDAGRTVVIEKSPVRCTRTGAMLPTPVMHVLRGEDRQPLSFQDADEGRSAALARRALHDHQQTPGVTVEVWGPNGRVAERGPQQLQTADVA